MPILSKTPETDRDNTNSVTRGLLWSSGKLCTELYRDGPVLYRAVQWGPSCGTCELYSSVQLCTDHFGLLMCHCSWMPYQQQIIYGGQLDVRGGSEPACQCRCYHLSS